MSGTLQQPPPMQRIYLDNAASTPMDTEVLAHMMPYFCEMYGNPSSTHSEGRALRGVVEQARRSIAKAIGAQPGEICFTSGGTEADNMAITGAVQAYGLETIITTRIEHHAVGHSVEQLEREGRIKAVWLPVDAEGHIDLNDLREALQQHPRALVSLMHGNNEIGTLIDLHAVGAICAEFGALFHSDTVQTMGHLPMNLAQTPVHFVTASGHKFYGPKGVGFLYIKQGTRIPSLIHGGGQERGLRAGTENPAAVAGMAFALDKCCRILPEKTRHLRELKQSMKTALLKSIPGVSFNGDTSEQCSLPTVLNVALPAGEADPMLVFNLDLLGISVSGGSACSSGANAGSHVLQGIGCNAQRISHSVRFSFGVQNTLSEIQEAVQRVQTMVQMAGVPMA